MSIFDFFSGSKKKQEVERLMTRILNRVHLPAHGANQREETRSSASLGVRVIPCQDDDKIDREAAFQAVTRDLTGSGISFVHRRQFLPGARLIISIEQDELDHHVLCEVKHCSNLGWGMFLTGCAIVELSPHRQELG